MMRMIMRKPLIDDPITNVERVAVELRTLRRARNITQQTLADRAQVARRTLTHAESAQNVGIQEWCHIANALGYELTLRPQNTVVFEELVQYGQRSGYAGDEASAVLDRIENAYATVTVRCEKDARYQNDPLLSGIRQAVERPALKAHQAPRLG